MGIDFRKCHGCNNVCADGGGFPQCDECRYYYCSDECGEFIRRNGEDLCHNCADDWKCAGCGDLIDDNGVFRCDKCVKNYCSDECGEFVQRNGCRVCDDCAYEDKDCAFCNAGIHSDAVLCRTCMNYYHQDCFVSYFSVDPKEVRDEVETNLRVCTRGVSACKWCPGNANESDACELCQKNKRLVRRVLDECKCGARNLCGPHVHRHNCDARMVVVRQKRFIEEYEEEVKNFVYKKLKQADEAARMLCKDMDGFPAQ